MDTKEKLLALPGTPQEEAWLRERLETLSANEEIVLTAVLQKEPPGSRADAIDRLFSLAEYEVFPSISNYRQLGEFYFKYVGLPETILPHTDLEKLGHVLERGNPGQFVGSCYVRGPSQPPAPVYDGNGAVIPKDEGWSVKIKLASPACPEGVWLRLPDYSDMCICPSMEKRQALGALRAGSLEECTLLDARCVLPEAGDLMEQYDSIEELVNDGSDLGFILDERGQGKAHWMEKLTAALEYEGCHDLRFALDIAQNLRCYEWFPCEDLAANAKKLLMDAHIPEDIIDSGCIDLTGYKASVFEGAGYRLTGDGSAYVARNGQEFIREYTAEPEHSEETVWQEQGGMTMQ